MSVCNECAETDPTSTPHIKIVHHVHFHVVPRISGDGLLQHPKSQGMIAKEDAEETLEALKKVL